MSDLTVTRQIHFSMRNRGRREIREGPKPIPEVTDAGRVPRVTRLMALAIKMNGLIESGAIADQAEAARLGHVSRARMTQIMNLLLLAPDIQEAILNLPRTMRGRDPVVDGCGQQHRPQAQCTFTHPLRPRAWRRPTVEVPTARSVRCAGRRLGAGQCAAQRRR